MRTVTLLLLVALAMVACARKPLEPAAPDEFVVSAAPPPPMPRVEVPRPVLDEILAGFRKIHFPLDSAELDAPALAVLATNGRLLVEHPSLIVEVEGHADERGTFDHNLALGAARADAVKKALLAFGVADVRVRTNTYGEERPAVDGHDEVAWAENRRAEFRVRMADAVR